MVVMLSKMLALTLVATLTLGGCASLQNPNNIDSQSSAAKTPATSPDIAEPPAANLEPEILYGLLVAELAGHHNRYDILLGNYLSAAKKTGDPGVAERATQVAVSLKAHKAALAAAELWHHSAPDSARAKQVLAGQLVINQNLNQAIELLEELLASNGEASFETLTANSQMLNPAQRNDLILQLDRLLKLYPNNTQILLSQSILLQLNGRSDEALHHANRLHKAQPGPRSLSLKAKLNHQLGRTEQALSLLKASLDDHPKSRPLRVLYAQMLVDAKQLLKAQQQFATLLQQHPHDHQLKLTLALLNLENNNTEAGNKLLQELTEAPRMADEAHYHLGQSAQKQNQRAQAIHHYQQVRDGARMLPAYHQLGTLLLQRDKDQQDQLSALHKAFTDGRLSNAKQSKSLYVIEAELITERNHIKAALGLLNQALEQFPNDINLLYTRAMTTEKTNDLVAMENDLRAILSQQPDNAMVLNALGYTLADRTTRYEEALTLIKRAKELKPDDPAITDSLGWTQFRLGNYQQAIELLEQAMTEYPDHEVAAHLGEALWVTGQQQRARDVWIEALQQTPDSIILKRVINRLSPELQKPDLK